jgi:hypothetical protein
MKIALGIAAFAVLTVLSRKVEGLGWAMLVGAAAGVALGFVISESRRRRDKSKHVSITPRSEGRSRT